MRLTPVRILRGVTLAALAAAVALILVNFTLMARRRVRVASPSGGLVEQKVERSERVRYFEVEKGKLRFQVTADRHFMGGDRRYHLEGDVEIVFPGRVDGRDVTFRGDEIVYDQEGRNFRLTGHAVALFKDLTLRSSALIYDAETDTLTSEKGVRFASDRLSGSAVRLQSQIRKERMVLRNKVELNAVLDWDPELTLNITGDRLDYNHPRGTGVVIGRPVSLEYGKSRAEADVLSFGLFSDRENLRSLALSGSVSAFFSVEVPDEGRAPEAPPGIFSAEQRELNADELSIVNFRDTFQARKLEARGNCRFRLNGESRSVEIHSDEMDGTLNPQGEIKKFNGSGRVRLTEIRESNDEEREIQGSFLSMEGRRRTIVVAGTSDRPALISTGEFRIQAGRIEMSLDEDDLQAEAGVSAVLDPDSGTGASLGFFSGEKSVFITAREMRYLARDQRFLFKETVKVWQDKDMLETSELVLFRDTGRLISRPPTRTMLTMRMREGEARDMVAISAETMEYRPRTSALSYEKSASFSVRDIVLEAESMNVDLNQETGEILTIAATGGVTIRQGAYEGLGQTAVYSVAQETIVLSGNPVLIDKTRGRTQGDKLTFHMADGRISVENQEGKRSRTVIKSER
jgi:lipopolysaccharide transport protein LptA